MNRGCVNRGGARSRIDLPVAAACEQEVELDGAALAALQCWEARPGEALTVRDADGVTFRARVQRLDDQGATLLPFEQLGRDSESSLRLEICQALPEKERFELILQKLTELGVETIVPFTSARSITLEERDAGQKKSHRWPQVVLKAAKQCRRAMLPCLYEVQDWDAMLWRAKDADLRLILSEHDAAWTLPEALGGVRPGRAALIVGPEGGFAPEEIDAARQLGFMPVNLGPRILRTETAAIAGATLLQYTCGDMG